MSQIYSKWCIVHHDPNFGDFLGPKFPSYSLWRELERNNLGNYLGGHLNIIPATVFPISCYFLRIKIAATA